MRKMFICAAVALLFSPRVMAQSGGQKTLLVVRDFDEYTRIVVLLEHAIQLKQAGGDVLVLFEGEAVLNLLPRLTAGAAEPESAESLEVDGVVVSTFIPAELTPYLGKELRRKQKLVDVRQRARTSSRRLLPSPGREETPAGTVEEPEEKGYRLLAKFEKLVPFLACSFSARLFDVYDELKAAGRPLSPETGEPVDLSRYIKDNYKIYVF